ncbi:ubiquinone biosynthesis accessory factor UbiJ [Litchfieldella rifensis]|uniref:Ubiquinone biosynthesis accessory factor UbiJ n=1 Tax=Litchfieldella rifensis TaxID=762643 RepID=A0ABV7LPU8_9GAMM
MLRLAEHTLNTLLSRDPAAPARLARLNGSRLLFCLRRPRLALAIDFDDRGLHLRHASGEAESAADVSVELDSEALGSLLGGESIERLMLSGRLAVRGRPQLLEDARDLLCDLDLDWETELANWLGDTPAHHLAEGARRLSRWGQRTRRELQADISEYVFEEARLLPGRSQFDVLRDHLTELEVATDRLEARVARLTRRLADREACQ